MILLALATAARADDPDRPSEDDLFGGAPTTTTPEAPAEPAAEPKPADTTLLGPDQAPQLTESDIASRLAEADKRLSIGGRAYLRLDSALTEDQAVKHASLASPSLLDVYFDARPNDRVRAYASARLQHDFTVVDGDVNAYGQPEVEDSVLLDQLWVTGDIAHHVFVTFGQQRVKWGSGRFWNPTDFLNAQRLDPLAVIDERTGVGLVKVHVPIESTGTNVYVLANLDGASSLNEVGGALRIEQVVATSEVALSAAVREDQPLRLGADWSAGVGPFDVHVESALLHGDRDPFWKGKLDFATLTTPTEYHRKQDWIPQVVAGAEVSIKYAADDTLSLGAEYFHNDAGYDDPGLYPWLLLEGQFVPFYLGRDYFGAYAYLPDPGKWQYTSFTASVLSNQSDRSYVARLDWRQSVHTYLAFNAYAAYHFGENGELHYALDIPAVPYVEGLEDGLSVAAPLAEVGAGAALTF